LGALSVAATRDNSGAEAVEQLLEAVVERKNMWLALKQVERNSGAAGVDHMTVQLQDYLREHWLRINVTKSTPVCARRAALGGR
jgi:hypothetical protein